MRDSAGGLFLREVQVSNHQAFEELALAAEERLAKLASGSSRPQLPLEHRHFARLYHLVTISWLERARQLPEPLFLHLLIIHFYNRYAACVLDTVIGDCEQIAWHWRPYFHITRRGKEQSRNENGLFWGILAHTGPDLSDAIALASFDYRKQNPDQPFLTFLLKIGYANLLNSNPFSSAISQFVDESGDSTGVLGSNGPLALKLIRHAGVVIFLQYRKLIVLNAYWRVFWTRLRYKSSFSLYGPVPSPELSLSLS